MSQHQQQASNKDYVDNIGNSKVSKSGDTMSGELNMGNHKSVNIDTPRSYENGATVNVGFFNKEVNDFN